MPQVQASIDNSTPDAAQRGMANKTWLWAGNGPAQIHYSTADGRDFAWVVGQRRIFAGEWQVNTAPGAGGQSITQICLRYPGVRLSGLSPDLELPSGRHDVLRDGRARSGDPLRINGRTQALFVLEKTPANLAEVQARVRN